ncbi:MAG: hypothetical protein JXA21_26320 [Anaerolineae bacterium]|nr:hypothetical protein [Anaerolineae bacterium]
MKNYGKTTVSEFLGDMIVYRNLAPVDTRIPSLEALREETGIPAGVFPRKHEPAYARAVAHMLHAARALDEPYTSLARLVYLGDTRMSDGAAFVNLCKATRCPGMAFIGAETLDEPEMDLIEQDAGTTCLANRWSMLSDFEALCDDYEFRIDKRTVVIIDLDKTALGARGRNASVIDQARVSAVRRTVEDLLGTAFDAANFRQSYITLNQPEFHPFTADNQDYLAYVCLIIGSGLYRTVPLIDDIRGGLVKDFAQFIGEVDARADDLPANLRGLHDDIIARVRAGDPTPFKAFRYNEYQETIGRMGYMLDDTPVNNLLENEVVITREVREVALKWKAQGALLFGLSDKPDEASIPTAEQSARGLQPIHRTETHSVGE